MITFLEDSERIIPGRRFKHSEFRFLPYFFDGSKDGGFGTSLLLDLVRSQILSVVPQVGFQGHPLVLAAFNEAKGVIQHSWKYAWLLRRSFKPRRALIQRRLRATDR